MTARDARRPKLIGFGLLLVTALGWGLNWPATKYLLHDCPPLTARGLAGIVAAFGLAILAASRGESLAVPARHRLRLVRAALLNVTAWMGLTTLSLVWLPAGEAATLAYTMPVWAALLAWPILGEKPAMHRVVALVLGLAGVALIVGGVQVRVDAARLPGLCSVISGAGLFALGTVLSKRAPLDMPPIAGTAWQVGLGCVPLLAASLAFEQPHLSSLPAIGWMALAYTALVSLGLCYLTWFAALRRLDAGTATTAMLLTPIIGVASSAYALGEALRAAQVIALVLVIAGVVLATRPVPAPSQG